MAPFLVTGLLVCLGLSLPLRPASAQLRCPAVCACTERTLTIDCSPDPGIPERLTVIPPGGSEDFTTL